MTMAESNFWFRCYRTPQPDYRRVVGRRQVPRGFEVRRRVHRPEQPGDELCRQVAGVTSAHEYDVGDEGRGARTRPPNVTPERLYKGSFGDAGQLFGHFCGFFFSSKTTYTR